MGDSYFVWSWAHLIMLGLYFPIPALVAGILFRGTPLEVLKAHVIWCALLFLVALSMNASDRGWILLIAMLTTVFAVPILVVMIKFFAFVRGRAVRS